MPLNPSVGHLYHDHNISNECTALDAKETMRTRESNAREAKHLAKYSYVIDRARSTYLKHNEWEQRSMRISLDNIKACTPSLSKSLLLETERKRLRDLQRSKLESCWSGHTMGRSVRTHQLQTVVSHWSVYSQLPDSAGYTDGYVSKSRNEQKSSCSSYNNCGQGSSSRSTKIDTLVRKADSITKALHKLYTKGIERKWRESNTTVLEVLGKESKEELEKALFILRGTATGDVIEDILRKKELVSKRGDERVLKLSSSSSGDGKSGHSSLDDALIARMNGDDADMIDKASTESSVSKQHSKSSDSTADTDKVLLNIEDTIRDKPHASLWDNAVFIEPIRKSKRDKSAYNTAVDIRGVFERDASWTMSSVAVNPSEHELNTRTMKWTQLLKAPELWKTNTYTSVRNAQLNRPKHVSLVTLAGKRRRTMINR